MGKNIAQYKIIKAGTFDQLQHLMNAAAAEGYVADVRGIQQFDGWLVVTMVWYGVVDD